MSRNTGSTEGDCRATREKRRQAHGKIIVIKELKHTSSKKKNLDA